MKPFTDRAAAGRDLANLFVRYQQQPDVLVLGLPRGGMPAAFEIARALDAPLDVMTVRKLGAPGDPELAIGALASGGVIVVNEEILAGFNDRNALDDAAAVQRIELARREQVYRRERPPLDVKGRTVILVDDGAATGATMRVAIRAVRQLGARKIVAAVPVASTEAYELLCKEADQVICIGTPEDFYAVGQWYEEFTPTTDEDVRDLLARASGLLARGLST